MFKSSSANGELTEVPSPQPGELQLHPALAATPTAATPQGHTDKPPAETKSAMITTPTQADASHKTPQQMPPVAPPKLSPIAGLAGLNVALAPKQLDAHSGASEPVCADVNTEEQSTPQAVGEAVKRSPSPHVHTGHPNSGSTNGSRNHSANQGNLDTDQLEH